MKLLNGIELECSDEDIIYLGLGIRRLEESSLFSFVCLIFSHTMYLAGIYKNHITARLAKVLGYSKNLRDFSITNLTKLDIPNQYGSYKIKDFLFVPPIIAYGKRLIGIATFGDEMYITYHLMEDSETDSEINYFSRVMERMKK